MGSQAASHRPQAVSLIPPLVLRCTTAVGGPHQAVVVPEYVIEVLKRSTQRPCPGFTGSEPRDGTDAAGCGRISYSTRPIDPLGVWTDKRLARVGARSFSFTFWKYRPGRIAGPMKMSGMWVS